MKISAALMAVLCASVFLVSGCGSYAVKPPAPISSDPSINSTKSEFAGEGLDNYFAFNLALRASYKAPTSRNNAQLLNEGMDLITSNCMSYFSRLGTADQHLRFGRKETALAGGVIAQMLALASASAKEVGNTAAVFAFASGTMDGYADTYIFSPDVKAVQALVRTALNAQKEEGNKLIEGAERQDVLGYTKVVSFLTVMESTCQPHGVRDLVNKAIAGQKAEESKDTEKTNSVLLQSANEQIKKLKESSDKAAETYAKRFAELERAVKANRDTPPREHIVGEKPPGDATGNAASAPALESIAGRPLGPIPDQTIKLIQIQN